MTSSACNEINAFLKNDDYVLTSHTTAVSNHMEILLNEIVCTSTLAVPPCVVELQDVLSLESPLLGGFEYAYLENDSQVQVICHAIVSNSMIIPHIIELRMSSLELTHEHFLGHFEYA